MLLNISGEHARTGVAADAGAAAAGYGHDVPQHQGQRLHHLSAHRVAGGAAVGALVRQQRRPKHRHVPPPAGRHRPPVRPRCFMFSLRLPFPRLFGFSFLHSTVIHGDPPPPGHAGGQCTLLDTPCTYPLSARCIPIMPMSKAPGCSLQNVGCWARSSMAACAYWWQRWYLALPVGQSNNQYCICIVSGAINNGSAVCILVAAVGIILSMLGLNLSGPESKIPFRLQGVGRNHQRQRGVRPGGGGGDSSLHAGPQPERAAHPGRRCAGVGGERSQPQLPGRLLPLRRPGKDFHILMF